MGRTRSKIFSVVHCDIRLFLAFNLKMKDGCLVVYDIEFKDRIEEKEEVFMLDTPLSADMNIRKAILFAFSGVPIEDIVLSAKKYIYKGDLCDMTW